MPAPRIIYIGYMVVAGFAMAFASLRWPVIHDGPIPPLMWLLALSAIVDLALLNRALAGKIEPLQMNIRVIGFIAGATIYFLLRQVLAG